MSVLSSVIRYHQYNLVCSVIYNHAPKQHHMYVGILAQARALLAYSILCLIWLEVSYKGMQCACEICDHTANDPVTVEQIRVTVEQIDSPDSLSQSLPVLPTGNEEVERSSPDFETVEAICTKGEIMSTPSIGAPVEEQSDERVVPADSMIPVASRNAVAIRASVSVDTRSSLKALIPWRIMATLFAMDGLIAVLYTYACGFLFDQVKEFKEFRKEQCASPESTLDLDWIEFSFNFQSTFSLKWYLYKYAFYASYMLFVLSL